MTKHLPKHVYQKELDRLREELHECYKAEEKPSGRIAEIAREIQECQSHLQPS